VFADFLSDKGKVSFSGKAYPAAGKRSGAWPLQKSFRFSGKKNPVHSLEHSRGKKSADIEGERFYHAGTRAGRSVAGPPSEPELGVEYWGILFDGGSPSGLSKKILVPS